MKYRTAVDGEWIQPRMRGYRLRCCSCKLVHVLDFRIVGKQVQFRATRNARATAASRRRHRPTTRSGPA